MARLDPLESFRGEEHLGPYVHPEHWDGHTLGLKPDGSEPLPQRPLVLRPGSRHFAREALETYINSDGPHFALERYQEGDVFNPGDHNPGTIVAIKTQMLHGPGRGVDLDFENIAAAPQDASLPSTKDLSRKLRITTPTTDEAGKPLSFRETVLDYITYQCDAEWGVVVRSVLGNNVLIVPPREKCDYTLPDATIKTRLFMGADRRRPIGQIEHSTLPVVARDVLLRTNVLEVYQQGKASESKNPVSIFLGRAAARPAIN